MDVEKAVIGTLINKPDLIVSIDLNSVDFNDMQACLSYAGIVEMWRDRKAIDLITLVSHIGDKVSPVYLADCSSLFVPTANFIEYARIISDKARIKRITDKSRILFTEKTATPETLLGGMASIFDEEGIGGNGGSSISEIIPDFDKDVEYSKENGWGIETGFSFFDSKSVMYSPCHIWVIGAFTSVGKTALLTEMVSRLDTVKNSVAIISTEMTKNQMVARLLANKTTFSSNVILSGGLYERNQPVLDMAKKDLAGQNINIFDDVFELTHIENTLTKLNMQSGVDIVFLDYLQNCHVAGSKSEYSEMATIAKRIQKLAKKIKATIVCLSQVSNASAQDDNGIMQFKGAGEFGAVTDVGITLRKKKTEPAEHILIDMQKHRHGAKGKQVIRYTKHWTRLEEIDHEANE